jgi:hypothetical protein
MKLLVDMNLSPGWVNLLAAAGIEAVHWSSLGAASAPDTEIMAYAGARGYVVLTHDLDFSAILRNPWRETERRANPRRRFEPERNRQAGHCCAIAGNCRS